MTPEFKSLLFLLLFGLGLQLYYSIRAGKQNRITKQWQQRRKFINYIRSLNVNGRKPDKDEL